MPIFAVWKGSPINSIWLTWYSLAWKLTSKIFKGYISKPIVRLSKLPRAISSFLSKESYFAKKDKKRKKKWNGAPRAKRAKREIAAVNQFNYSNPIIIDDDHDTSDEDIDLIQPDFPSPPSTISNKRPIMDLTS